MFAGPWPARRRANPPGAITIPCRGSEISNGFCRLAVFFCDGGFEQDGGPQAAKNMPVACFLVRGSRIHLPPTNEFIEKVYRFFDELFCFQGKIKVMHRFLDLLSRKYGKTGKFFRYRMVREVVYFW